MKAPSVKPVRCAIYTRVSTDHGLDQEFNSLDAQYDADDSAAQKAVGQSAAQIARRLGSKAGAARNVVKKKPALLGAFPIYQPRYPPPPKLKLTLGPP
jgi:hypothetical protein